jgi:threonine dehydrogenase-like Zn-dependent dehydrogenase
MTQKQLAAVLHADWKARPEYQPTQQEIATRRATYASRVWHNPKVVVEEIPIPDIGSKDVLVKLKACGICGSDMHLYESDKDGYILYPGLVKTPVVLGHELSGQIERVGSEVSDLKAGDMVVCEEMWWCGECDPCRTGYLNQCVNLMEMGFTDNGGCEQFMRIHQKFCWKINDFKKVFRTEDKVYEAGSLVEPACVAYNAMFVRAGGFKPGSAVVVWGAGPIGLGAIALAKAAGAGKIIAFEPRQKRGEIAKSVGADEVLDQYELVKSGGQPWQKILEFTNGEGVDMQVESAGDPSFVMPQAERCMNFGGKIVQIGRADKSAPVFFELYQTRALQAYGSQGHAGNSVWPNVIKLMASGRLDTTKIITSRYSIADVPKALQKLKDREDAKVTIKP